MIVMFEQLTSFFLISLILLLFWNLGVKVVVQYNNTSIPLDAPFYTLPVPYAAE